MPSPSPSSAVQRPDLGATMEQIDLDASRSGFVGLKIMPVAEVAEQSANIGKIPVAELLRVADTRRASTGGYSRSEFQFNEYFYATDDHGHEVPIDDRLKKVYRRYFDAEVVATKRARDVVLRAHERRVCVKLTDTDAFQDSGAGTAWSTHQSADPIANILTAKLAVRSQCGLIPNVVVMDWEAFQHCRECDAIIDRLKYSGFQNPEASKITTAVLAQVFDVDEVVVAGGQRNTAQRNESQALTLASLWDKTKVFVGVRATSMDFQEPSVGRTFHWSEDGSDIGTVVETYRDERTRGDVVRARFDVDERVHYAECGYILTGVL